MVQLKIKETTPVVLFFLRLWKMEFYFEHPSSFCFNVICTNFHLWMCFPPLFRVLFYLQRVKRQRIFVGGGGNPHWRSGWVPSYLFTVINIKSLAFDPALLDDERHLEEKGLLSPFSNFFCLHQCFILIFHSSLPLFPFSTVTVFCFGNKKGMKGKTTHPATVADSDKSVGEFFRNLREETPVVSQPTSFSCPGNNGSPACFQGTRWDMGLVFSFSSKLQTWANNHYLTHMENLQTQTHSCSPISAGMKGKLQISSCSCSKVVPSWLGLCRWGS